MTGISDAIGAASRELELRFAAEEQREIELTESERWARDPVALFETGELWIGSKFSDGGGAHAPTRIRPVRFHPFPAQLRTLAAWVDLETLRRTGLLVFRNIAIEKSRQIGETWAFAAILWWLLHFHASRGLAMHTDQGEIDDGGRSNTEKSLFGKVRYIDGRADRQAIAGLGELEFRPFSTRPATIQNLARGGIVYGEGQTDNPGRGGTFDYALADEAAFIRHGEKVYAALDEACPDGKALLSTVNGDTNWHARICDERPANYEYLRLHWSEHPVYSQGLHVAGEEADCAFCEGNRQQIRWVASNPQAHRYPGRLTSPWYDARVIGKTDEQVANELDIDRARALGGRVYAEFQQETHVESGGLPYSQELGIARLELFWDFGLDATSVVVCQDAPADYRVIGILERGDLWGTTATPELVSDALLAYLEELGVETRTLTKAWTRRMTCVGDPAGQDRNEWSGRPFVHAYRRLGWNIVSPSRRYTKRAEITIAAVKRLLTGVPKPLRVCGVNAAEFALHARNNTWPTDESGRRRIGSTRPNDDEHNHAMRAFAYGIVWKWPHLADPYDDDDDPPPPGQEEPETPEALVNRRREAGVLTGFRQGMSL